MESQNLNPKSQNQIPNPKSDIRYRSYIFSINIIRLIRNFPEKRVYWILGDQLLRAATSIGANLVEAKSSNSKKDFARYYEIAMKSANETRYWLCLIRDSKLYDGEYLNGLNMEAEEIANMLGASLLTMRKKNKI